jgi:Fe-S-cluster-containing dehydrogenase component/anaerobic selenocysteine-containing dehydrogenase
LQKQTPGDVPWSSLGELFEPEKYRQRARDEFPNNFFNRRTFLKWIGASVALGSLPACTRQPLERIVPYVRQPENLVPGKPLYFATAMTLGGFATGLVGESHEGHPTKIEGNPGHPASLGATNIFHQAAVLDCYDPDRSQSVMRKSGPDTWENFVAELHEVLRLQQIKNGSGLRILTETITSPTLHFQIRQLLKKFSAATWHQWEAANRDNVREGSRLAFGEIVETHYHFSKAKVILSLESDFLYSHPDSIRHARDFAGLRRARFPQVEMSRLYVVESTPTITGANADHRLPLRSGEVGNFAAELAAKLGAVPKSATANPQLAPDDWLSAVADDLLQNRGASIVIAGESQPSEVHALAHSLNQMLGNSGNTVTFIESAEADPVNQTSSLRELVEALRKNAVEVLVIFGGNPGFNAPADFQFAGNLARAKFKAHLSADVNETSVRCDWHIPQNHFLESWSDARAFDGTISIVQPLILPLYGGKSAHEILDAMLAPPGRGDYEIVREFWQSQNSGDEFEHRWRRALHDGFIQNSALPAKNISPRALPEPLAMGKMAARRNPAPIEITFRPDPTIHDGRFANNGWLQELPKPVTKLVWDNAALVSPALAAKENLSNGDVIEIQLTGGPSALLRLPVWITPGQAPDSISLSFGYGRKNTGRVGEGTGFDVFPLRASNALWSDGGAIIRKTGERHPLVTTQSQHIIDSEERQIFREGAFAEFKRNADFVRRHSETPDPSDTLFDPKEFSRDGYRWGMAIDLSACIGCSACVVACYAENNIPVVGKEQVAAGRDMQWIRVDNYFRGSPENPQVTHQPVLCMHCENAPCEVVCPVGATLHDSEGLNLQVYQRCVGTRYCSNNCPYKVRRFNFLEYADYRTPSLKPMWNPNVTVRWRGVMEKCTYCIQRISEARINSENENRKIRDGEIQTACQQVCPANAIVFGDLSDAQSRVSKLKTHQLNFLMLGELNTRPRTSYLAKLRNPNPKLAT